MKEKTVILSVIFRPFHGNFSLFLQEIECLILENEIHEADVNHLGVFNTRVDDITKFYVQNFLRLLNNFSLVNLVNEPT